MFTQSLLLLISFAIVNIGQLTATSSINNTVYSKNKTVNDNFKVKSVLKFIDTEKFYFHSGEWTTGRPSHLQLECDIFKSESGLCFDEEVSQVECDNANYNFKPLPKFECQFPIDDKDVIVAYKINCNYPMRPNSREYYEENTCYLVYSLNKDRKTLYIIIGISVSAVVIIISAFVFICIRRQGGCRSCLAECSESGGGTTSGTATTTYR